MKYTKWVLPYVAALALALPGNAQSGKVEQSVVFGGEPSSRLEAVVKLPYDIDVKGKLQLNGKLRYKFRVQAFPFSYGRFSLGGAVKHTNDGTEVGVAGRYKWDSGKTALRIYPDGLHSKTSWESEQWFTEAIAQHDFAGEGSLRVGVDRKLADGFAVGLEGRMHSDPEKNYLGLRMRFSGRFGSN